jgi:type III restriction enzyme
VFNDEAHHAWRPPSVPDEGARAEAGGEPDGELEEATIWINGLDMLQAGAGIAFCVDLSATPFYIAGSGQPEGVPFPWLVSDFGLVDAIECGIVKIPRLPVSDTTGRPEARYYRLWENINEGLSPGQRLPGKAKKPKPEVVYQKAEDALLTLASQWVERFAYIQAASNAQDKTPPVLIVVCDNTDVAEVFYRNIAGEQEIEEVVEVNGKAKVVKRTVYGDGRVFPEHFANREGFKPTIRIDSKLLAAAERGEPGVSRQDAAEQLRQVVATVGKRGAPGEQVRCVVSVAMLTEGWDAANVTHILGLRAFGSQLLCEQVVGRGLRRMDYTPDPATGLLREEYVDIYGVPFSLIPFRGRAPQEAQPNDRPPNHVMALEERREYEMRFPVVEGFVFALNRSLITADIGAMQPLVIDPGEVPTATFVSPQVGYRATAPGLGDPFAVEEQDREAYYRSTHLQAIEFQMAQQIVQALTATSGQPAGEGGVAVERVRLGGQSRHQLFPQVLRLVHAYIARKVQLRGVNACELGQEVYFRRVVERLLAAIRPDEGQGEPPLLPILNRYQPYGSTAGVDFKTVRPCFSTRYSHINLVAADTQTWEQTAAFRLEQGARRGIVACYARNDGLGFTIPYEFGGVPHHYEPDYLVRLANGMTVLVEIKGWEDEQDRAKHEAARRWCDAVNHWGEMGRWGMHVTRDPQVLLEELSTMLAAGESRR